MSDEVETPFKLQGFRIQKDAELRLLEKYCRFVYVDVERGVAPPRGKGERITLTEEGEVVPQSAFIATSSAARAEGAGKRVGQEAARTALPAPAVEYSVEVEFETELPRAITAVTAAKEALRAFVRNFDQRGKVELEGVREAAHVLEASLLRNPDPAMLVRALPSEEPFSFRHSVHSAILGIALARDLGFRKQAIHELAMGVLLADIGKTRLPKELLRARRRLDPREAEIVKLHVRYGVEMATALDSLTPGTIGIIASHHERFNGSGYPSGLRGGEIPVPARIAGLADSFDALTSERAYSEPIPTHEAVQELYAATVDVFQRDLVEKLIQVLGTYPLGSLVELSDGAVAVVVALNRSRRLLPKVVRLTDAARQPAASLVIEDLSAGERPAATVKEVLDPDRVDVPRPIADRIPV